MTWPALQKVGAMVKDALTPEAVGYVVVILRREIWLLRVRNRGISELDKIVLSDMSQESIKVALRRIARNPKMYGQPVAIVVDNSFSYLLSIKLSVASAKRDIDEFRALVPDRVEATWTVVDAPSGKILLCTGLDRSFAVAVRNECEKVGISVRGLAAFGLHLIGTLLHTQTHGPSLHVVPWNDRTYSYAGLDRNGTIFAGSTQLRTSSSSGARAIVSLSESLFGAGVAVPAQVYMLSVTRSKKAKSDRSLGSLLTSPLPKQLRGAWTRNIHRMSRPSIMFTIQNSAKLLSHILVIASFIFLGAAGVSELLAGGDPDITEKYQLLHSTQTSLEERRELLRTEREKLDRTAKLSADPAALTSIFCQTKASSLSLTTIMVKALDGDSLAIEATGRTRSSGTIFEYAKSINATISPHQLSVRAFQPEILAGMNRPDTTLRFKLGMTVHGGK